MTSAPPPARTLAVTGRPAAATRPVRIGVHGSPRLVEKLLDGCGHRLDEVRLVPYSVAEPFAPMRAGLVDLTIVKYTLSEPGIATSEPVGYDARAALLRAGHPLAGRPSVSLEELSGYEAFSCPGDFPPYVWDLVVPRRTPLGRPIRRVHPMTTLAEAAALLARTDAVHTSFASVADALPPGVIAVPISDLPPAPVALAWLRDPGPGDAAARLVRDAERAVAR